MSGYQVMPRLTPDEYADLEQSIKTDGVLVPIIVSPGGEIIDGHHRAEIARRLGVQCPEVVKHGDPAELRTFAYSLNLNRRHLTREQRRELIAQSLRQDPQLADREHARRTGASPTTVGTARAELEDAGRLSKLDSRTSGDGRLRPATQPLRPAAALADEAAEQFAGSDADHARRAAEVERALRADREVLTRMPSTQRRRPLPDAFFDTVHDLTRLTERIARLGEDDRFPQNAEQVAARHRNDLLRARDALQGVIDRLPSA